MGKFLIVCDVEGTIFQAKYQTQGTDYYSSMWQPIANKLGKEAEAEEWQTEVWWKSKNYYDSYKSWVKDTTYIHQKYGLTKEIFDEVLYSAEYMPGVEEFFRQLDSKKYFVLLISGGFQNMINRAIDELGINGCGYGSCEYFFDNKTGKMLTPKIQNSDYEHKINYLKKTINEINGNYENGWAFFGDGPNDIHIAGEAPLVFGMRHDSKLNDTLKGVKNIIEIDSFTDAIDKLEEQFKYFKLQEDEYNNSLDIQKKAIDKRRRKKAEKDKNDIEIVKKNDDIKDIIFSCKKYTPSMFYGNNKEQLLSLLEYYFGYDTEKSNSILSESTCLNNASIIKKQANQFLDDIWLGSEYNFEKNNLEMLQDLHSKVSKFYGLINIKENIKLKPCTGKQLIFFTNIEYGEYLVFSKIAQETFKKFIDEKRFDESKIVYVYNELYKIVLWVKNKRGEITDTQYKTMVTHETISPALGETKLNKLKNDKKKSIYIGDIVTDMHLKLTKLNIKDPRVYFGYDIKCKKAVIGKMFTHL